MMQRTITNPLPSLPPIVDLKGEALAQRRREILEMALARGLGPHPHLIGDGVRPAEPDFTR